MVLFQNNDATTLKSKTKIMVVDDDRMNRTLAQKMLTIIGYQCEVAFDGHNCLEKLAKDRYDAILMDCDMPTLDGLDTTKLIRTNPDIRSMIIIAMTANDIDHSQKSCRDAGMDAFMAKPLDLNHLQSCLESLLEEQQLQISPKRSFADLWHF